MTKEPTKKEESASPDLPESEDEITQLTPEEEVSLEKKLKEMEDKYLRTYADFENYRKRVSKEKEEIVLMTSENLLKELLEVKDHLELALSHSKEAPEAKGLREGVDLTLKQLGKFLEKFGVTEIEPLGEKFDPAFHEAIHEEVSLEYQPGMIVHVYQKGYLFHGRLLRAARVTVASAQSPRAGDKK